MNIYIHIPFCASKCSYCHFYSTTNTDHIGKYVKAVCVEIELRIPTPIPIDTIYFGGGTPSLLNPIQLEQILNSLRKKSTTTPIEITLEANPESLNKKILTEHAQIGINRVSIGVQTWNQPLLRHMNRSFAVTNLPELILHAKEINLSNINIDHIIAYPNQSDEILIQDIKTTLQLDPTHISIYPLEIHPHTRLCRHRGASEQEIVHQFSLAQTMLMTAGYAHYEELSFAKNGYECRHNFDFWSGKDYIGIGVSAASKNKSVIATNNSSIPEYIDSLSHSQVPPKKSMEITPRQSLHLAKDLNSRLLK